MAQTIPSERRQIGSDSKVASYVHMSTDRFGADMPTNRQVLGVEIALPLPYTCFGGALNV